MDLEAIENLREALAISPGNIVLRLHLANMLLNGKQYNDAEKEFLATLGYDSNSSKAKTGLAKAYMKQLKHPAASLVIEEMLEEDENNITFLAMLAECQLALKAMGDAIETYQRILAINPAYTNTKLDNALRAGQQQMEEDGVDDDALHFLTQPGIDFSSVGGMEREKEEISLKIIHPLNHPDLYKAYGKKAGGGILFYGPPGCGKTHLAKATAGQINAKFLNVGINDILDMWIGNSEKNLHEIFDIARKNTPCVLFFDEIDALGANRSDMRQSAGRALINQFLAELDGINADNDGLLIMGATNAPWHLDPAFRRPGRFDRIIFVSPPDVVAREAIWEIMLEGKPVSDIDVATLAKKTGEYSGADIMAALDIAIEGKLKTSFASGIPEPLSTKDLIKASKQHKASTKEWFSTARNYALYANDSGLYDEILSYLKIKK